MDTIATISAALRRLDLSQNEQTMYLSLLRHGRATARLLADRTGLTRPSVYDQLKKLGTLGLVVELAVDGKTYFAASDIKHLEALLDDRIDRLTQSRDFLRKALPEIEHGLDTVVPKIRFFEGEEGLKQLLKDVMWYDHQTMVVCWNDSEMNTLYDAAFLHWWNERRILRQLAIVWQVPVSRQKTRTKTNTPPLPTLFAKGIDSIQTYEGTLQPMTRLMYGTKVACVSSRQEAFGFIVESREFAQLQFVLSVSDTHTR